MSAPDYAAIAAQARESVPPVVAFEVSDGYICADPARACVDCYVGQGVVPLDENAFEMAVGNAEGYFIRCRSCMEMIRPDLQGWYQTYAAKMGMKP
jgi:hypothetical protein